MGLLKSKIFPFFKRAKKFLVGFLFFVAKLFFLKKKENIKHGSADLDKKLVYSLSKSKIPTLGQIKYIGKVLSRKEAWLVRVLTLIIIFNIFFLGYNFLKNNLLIVPILGGSYIEGLVGVPKHINPLYSSISDVDSDLAKLVFSSLFKYDKNGKLSKDLVSNYEISEDGKRYTIYIKDNVYWHHGEKLTVDDIIFTFSAMKDSRYESPLRISFSGVSIEKKDENSVNFILTERYAAFLDLLTFGIIPQDLWFQFMPESASLAEPNLKPIGSGPYKFKTLVKDKSGNIKMYNLEVNEEYYGKKPYVENLSFKFFINFTEAVSALNENIVDGISYLPRENRKDLIARDSLSFHNLELPQLKAVFINQEKNKALVDVELRRALAFSIPKESLVKDVLEREARVADGPILSSNFAYNNEIEKYEYDKEKAEELLDGLGWGKVSITREDIDEIILKEETSTSTEEKLKEEEENKKIMGPGEWRVKKAKDNDDSDEYLIIELTTIDDEESIKVVENIKRYWEEVGIKVSLNIVPVNRVQAEIIEPRDFECLFFGQVVGNDPDSYVFWHSSQIGEGGLNLANYANDDVDKMLEEARLTLNEDERIEKYKEFQKILTNDTPTIFLFSPFYTYIQDKKIKGFEVKNISSPADRLSNIDDWYIKTGKRIIFPKK